jgi:DNA-binding NtrC family response regulator
VIPIPIDVLIVDDEIDFAEALALRLEARDHRVRLAGSGEEALDALDAASVDVVVLDLVLPGMDGVETLAAIRARHPLVEVILLTGHGTVDSAVAGLKAGAFDYVRKPAHLEELLEKLEAARRRKAEHEDRIRAAEARALRRRTGDV